MLRQWQDDVRRIATLLSRDESGTQPQVVLFTACARGVGTTTVVLQTAEILQEVYQRRVLIIELNSRRPRLARVLKLDREKGLLQLSDDSVFVSDHLQKLGSGVTVLPAGRIENRGALRPDVRPLLLRALRQQAPLFDIVLIDAPPVTEDSDALAAARSLDKVAVVVRAGRTSGQALTRISAELTRPDGTRPELIVVLNRYRRIIPGWIDRWLS
jgi:Mrp family chromosome partitioning ATPase